MSAGLLDHLWQSSLVALVAWLLTRLLHRNQARLRFTIWLAASVKFLIPFSLLSQAGAQAGQWLAPARQAMAADLAQMAAPLINPASAFVTSRSAAMDVALALTMLWTLVSAALLLRWYARWREVRRIVRQASPTSLSAPIPVLASATLSEPGVVGIFNPVLLLPLEITGRLSAKELNAILEHELCHVRRRDNLWAAIHMVVEVVFWFHPLVWWIGSRLVDERERACDEAVLESGMHPRSYAQGILKVCQFYMASKLACVSGVSGANLKIRLEGIMKNQKTDDLNHGRKWLLGAVALAVVGIPLLSGLANPPAQAAEGAKASAAPIPAGKITLLPDRRVKLDYENVDVRSLLQSMAQAANVNMLVSDQVTGSVTVRLESMPWEQALDVVLASKGLGRQEKSGIILVEPLSPTRN
jgi:beta-lactamase regulating signal transducer with metallopeptidase domain